MEQLATRQRRSIRQINMTLSMAFLAPALVNAAVESHLPRGVGIAQLRDAPLRYLKLPAPPVRS